MQKYAILVSEELQISNGVCSLDTTEIKQHMGWGFQDHSFVLDNPCIYTVLEGNKMYMMPSNLLFVHFFCLRDHVCVTDKASQS